MVNSSLTPRRVVTAVGLVILVSMSGCSSLPSFGTRAARDASNSSSVQAGTAAGKQAAGTVANVYERRVIDFESSHTNRNSHAKRILYADALLHLDEARKAIQVLLDAEDVFHGSYLNSLYLGLAYEKVGELKQARYWVSRTIERNIDARGGTEWLHLAMIEARLALARDPEWLKSNSVLRNNTHRTAEEILTAIRIQLAVQGDFGLKQDSVVCDLYFEAGICATGLSARRDYFAQSLEIGALRRAEIEKHEKISARAHASVQVN